jgi:hypothetical protein
VGNNRQGISVITAENLLIEGCVFRDTQGTAPQAGIDFEPNHPEERLVHCVLRNCRSEANSGHAYHIYLGHMHQDSPPVSIRFENCTSSGCQRYSTYVGVANRNGRQTVRGSIEYVGCRFEADTGGGVYIRGNEADGCLVRFRGCEIIRRDTQDSPLAPITIEAPRRLDLDAGNIEIADCRIHDSIARQPITLSASPMTRLRNVRGSFVHHTPEGETELTLDAEQIGKWWPDQGLLDKIPRRAFDWRKTTPPASEFVAEASGGSFRLRGRATLLVWGQADCRVELTVKTEPVGRHDPIVGVMTLTTPNGEANQMDPNVRENQATYAFTPRTTGPHRLDWQGNSNTTMRPLSCSAPCTLFGESLGLNMIRPLGTLYFGVPAGVERFALQVAGAGTAETVKVEVRDASQRLVDQRDNIAAPHVFVLERQPARPAETWSVTFQRATDGVLEDVAVQTLGIPPLFGASLTDVLLSSEHHQRH